MLLITLAMVIAFILATARATHSLERLTEAAGRVAEGDLRPSLPSKGMDEVGTLSEAFGMMLDRIRLMIEQVEKSRQLAVVGEFAAQIAHEIRNPLTAIRMNLQGLARRAKEPGEQRSLEIALRETDRLDRVARGVLTLGRRRNHPRKAVSVRKLVHEAVEAITAELQHLGVVCEPLCEEGHDDVMVDEEAVRAALINLLCNAMEAMSGGGLVRLTTTLAADDVEIHIVDDGPGFSPEMAERAFEPFATTKERGNGIGLPLALQTAEAHGGRLRLEPGTDDGGAHLVLSLPIHPKS